MKRVDGRRKRNQTKARWAIFIYLMLMMGLLLMFPSRAFRARALTNTVLHLHGNPNDDSGSTGDGQADVANTADLPALKTTATLGAGPAFGHWDVGNPALDGNADRNPYDPNWTWTLTGPTRIGGQMTLQWWATCGACGSTAGLDAEWTIRIWVDGVEKFEQIVTATPTLPNVTQLLTTTIFVKENIPAETNNPITANSKIVLHIDPVFIDSQNNTHIYYDSQSPCPGTDVGTTAPCDSQVTMPVLDAAEPLPTPPAPVGRTATYVSGGLTFSPNVTVKAPVAAADGEPSNRTDKLGNFYVSGIRGFPAGIDLWYFDLQPVSPTYDPYMRRPSVVAAPGQGSYKGQPDAFNPCTDPMIPPSPCTEAELGGDGGGDVDLAVGFPDPGTGAVNNPPTLAYSSLIAANISTGKSPDRANTYIKNPLGNATGGVVADDRQWEEFYGKDTVYLFYRTLAPAISQIQRSTDGGLTFGPTQTAGTIGQAGYIDVHQATGTVYVSGSTGNVCTGVPSIPGAEPTTVNYTCHLAASDPNGVAHLFFVVKVADDGTANGTVYACYSNDHDVFLVHSKDKGATWSAPVRVSDNTTIKTNIFPWIETGPTPGSVGIVWYGTTEPSNNNNANWNVYFAQSFDADSNTPTFRQAQVSDHFIHGSNISEGGLLGNANRNLLDYFQVSFDPNGAAVVGYTDDHNDFTGHTYVSHQISGPGISGVALPDPGPTPTPDTEPIPHAADVGGISGSQVTDFRHDMRVGGNPETGGLIAPGTDDPVDILSIKYSTEPLSALNSSPALVATMKVSGPLSPTPPPDSFWRMNFTANAPDSVLSPTGDITFGLSDRGDQFYLKASTDPSSGSIQSFVYGTAVRNPDGSITYTDKGAADCGLIDIDNNTITVKVRLGKLNDLLPSGHAPIGVGSTLAGLRGSAFTSANAAGNTSGNNKQDITRGGTQYSVALGPVTLSCAPTAASAQIRGSITTADGSPLSGVTVRLNGTHTTETITDSLGNYSFPNLEAGGFYTVIPSRANYSFSPATREISLVGDRTDAIFTASAIEETANPLDTSEYFVRQQYLDFLDREPDMGGFNYWSAQINQCGADADCIARERINVSAAFFMEREFQQTGSFVYGLYKASLGRDPRFAEFMPDRSRVIGGAQLEAGKQALAADWVTRPEFKSDYPDSLSAEQFVNKLFDTAGLTGYVTERESYISAMQSGAATRAQVLKGLIESDAFRMKEYNRAFVLTEYFSYLRRDPDEAGLAFWLGILNKREPNNYRGMVCSFITSKEYQKRFGTVASHSNAECGQ